MIDSTVLRPKLSPHNASIQRTIPYYLYLYHYFQFLHFQNNIFKAVFFHVAYAMYYHAV